MTAEAQGAGPAPHAGTGPLFHTRARALTAGDVTTAETIGGVSIALRRSPARFVGVLAGELSEDPSKSEIAILCDNGDTLPLAVEGDIDVVAEWRAASRRFGLPMIIQRPDGGVIAQGDSKAKAPDELLQSISFLKKTAIQFGQRSFGFQF